MGAEVLNLTLVILLNFKFPHFGNPKNVGGHLKETIEYY
jgi:hypothetical protein